MNVCQASYLTVQNVYLCLYFHFQFKSESYILKVYNYTWLWQNTEILSLRLVFKDLGIVFFISLLEFLIFKNSDKASIVTHTPVNLSLSASLVEVHMFTSLCQFTFLSNTSKDMSKYSWGIFSSHALFLLDTLVQDQHPTPPLFQYNSHSAQLSKKCVPFPQQYCIRRKQ